ncbi:MAG: cytochrome c3 family protein [Desulfobacterales bacterium]|nr:cytochrome c3 family protein [Desulfobacterales bacterium]
MKYKLSWVIIILLSLLIIFFWLPSTFGQDNNVAKSDLTKPGFALCCFPILVTPKRVVPSFDHTLHEESIGVDSCAKCHHVLNTKKNKLLYSEGEEEACTECHTEKKQGNTMALKDASHETCTGCHRQMKKVKKIAGPTTCGECHKK